MAGRDCCGTRTAPAPVAGAGAGSSVLAQDGHWMLIAWLARLVPRADLIVTVPGDVAVGRRVVCVFFSRKSKLQVPSASVGVAVSRDGGNLAKGIARAFDAFPPGPATAPDPTISTSVSAQLTNPPPPCAAVDAWQGTCTAPAGQSG